MLFACQNGSIDICSVVLGLLVTVCGLALAGLFSTYFAKKIKSLIKYLPV